jgi:hypothetical protein
VTSERKTAEEVARRRTAEVFRSEVDSCLLRRPPPRPSGRAGGAATSCCHQSDLLPLAAAGASNAVQVEDTDALMRRRLRSDFLSESRGGRHDGGD